MNTTDTLLRSALTYRGAHTTAVEAAIMAIASLRMQRDQAYADAARDNKIRLKMQRKWEGLLRERDKLQREVASLHNWMKGCVVRCTEAVDARDRLAFLSMSARNILSGKDTRSSRV